MKIGTPELKTKPATKYGDHFYIAFSTVNKELFYKIMLFSDGRDPVSLFTTPRSVKDETHLKQLLSIKTREKLLEVEA